MFFRKIAKCLRTAFFIEKPPVAAFSRIGSLDEFRLPDCFSGVLQTLRLYQYANFDYTFLRFVHIFFSFFGVCRCSRFIFYLRCVSCFESHWYSTFNFYKSSSSQPTFLLFCQVLFKQPRFKSQS